MEAGHTLTSELGRITISTICCERSVSNFAGVADTYTTWLRWFWNSSAVSGRLKYREWDSEGSYKRHDYEVVGHIEFLAAPRQNDTKTEPDEVQESTL